jgi:hypothetical protein
VVLDVGCAGHGGDMSRGNWLHARIQEVAAACLGIDIWENADHLFYIFSSGIVEMAERTGLRLVEWFTVGWDDRWFQLRRSLTYWCRALFTATPSHGPIWRPAWIKYVDPLEALLLWRKWKWGTMGETAVYVLQKSR